MHEEDFDDEIEFYAVRPNKSQIKREIAELAVFADALVGLSVAQLKQFELDDELFHAITIAAGLPASGAKKRQMKYICGLLRKVDVAPLQECLARLQSKSAHAVREHHAAERWREELLVGDDMVITRFLHEFPDADRQQLRHLIRSAKKEITISAPPKFSRMLYRFLKDVIV